MRYGFLNPITRCFFPYGPNIAQRYKSRNLIGAIKGKIYTENPGGAGGRISKFRRRKREYRERKSQQWRLNSKRCLMISKLSNDRCLILLIKLPSTRYFSFVCEIREFVFVRVNFLVLELRIFWFESVRLRFSVVVFDLCNYVFLDRAMLRSHILWNCGQKKLLVFSGLCWFMPNWILCWLVFSVFCGVGNLGMDNR